MKNKTINDLYEIAKTNAMRHQRNILSYLIDMESGDEDNYIRNRIEDELSLLSKCDSQINVISKYFDNLNNSSNETKILLKG